MLVGQRNRGGEDPVRIETTFQFSFALPVTIFRPCKDWLVTKLVLLGPIFRHSSTGLKHQIAVEPEVGQT
jgi:hypothetical protein